MSGPYGVMNVSEMNRGLKDPLSSLSVSVNENKIGMPNPNTCSAAVLASLKSIRDKQTKIVNDHASALSALHATQRQELKNLQAAQLVALNALRKTQDAATHALDATHDIAHNLVNKELSDFIKSHPGCGSVSVGHPSNAVVDHYSYAGD